MNSVTLKGVFTWGARERRSDRYGGIMLVESAGESESAQDMDLSPVTPLIGRRVKINTLVLEARDSHHIGDIMRGIFPSTPKVGDLIELGTGTLVGLETVGEYRQMLFCRDGREDASDWMDPKDLYRLHDQTVELTLTALMKEHDFDGEFGPCKGCGKHVEQLMDERFCS